VSSVIEMSQLEITLDNILSTCSFSGVEVTVASLSAVRDALEQGLPNVTGLDG
jgi:hypothetical protein